MLPDIGDDNLIIVGITDDVNPDHCDAQPRWLCVRCKESFMGDINIKSTRGLSTIHAQQEYLIEDGLAPLVPHHNHPTLIHRWSIPHIISPLTSNLGGGGGWQSYIWSDAWIVCLFVLTNSLNVLKNAVSTVESYKPKILDLKIRYDEARLDKHKKLVLLVEATMTNKNPVLLRAANKAIARIQNTLIDDRVPQ